MDRKDKSTTQQLEEKRKRLEELRKLKEAREHAAPVSAIEPGRSRPANIVSAEPRVDPPSATSAKSTAAVSAPVSKSGLAAPSSGLAEMVETLLQESAGSTPSVPRMLVTDRDVWDFNVLNQSSVRDTIDVPVQTDSDDIADVALQVASPSHAASFQPDANFLQFFENAITTVERELGPFDAPGFRKQHGDSLAWSDTVLQDSGCVGRAVCALDWCRNNPAQLISSYVGPSSIHDIRNAAGVALLWNVGYPSKPIGTFHYAAPITCVKSCPNSHAFVAGAFDGTLLIFDPRSGTNPVQKSRGTETSHIQPIVSIMFTEDRSPTSFYSVSSDGRLCQYGMQKVDEPMSSTLILVSIKDKEKEKDKGVSRPIFTTSTVLSPWKTSGLFVGGVEGGLYGCEFTGRAAEAGCRVAAHYGAVAAMSHHLSQDHSLLLTASLDGTVKLWDVEGIEPRMLECFEASDAFVNDVAWSPTHSTVFAACDADGLVFVYDPLREKVDPVTGIRTTSDGGFTKLRWAADGKSIACGDTNGAIRFLEVGDDLAASSSGASAVDIVRLYDAPDAWKSFARGLDASRTSAK